MIREGRHLLLSVDRAVLIGQHWQAVGRAIGHGEKARGGDRQIASLGNDRVVSHAVEIHCSPRRTIDDLDAGEGRRVGLQDLVELLHVPAGEKLVAHARYDLDRPLVLCQGGCREDADDKQEHVAQHGGHGDLLVHNPGNSDEPGTMQRKCENFLYAVRGVAGCSRVSVRKRPARQPDRIADPGEDREGLACRNTEPVHPLL